MLDIDDSKVKAEVDARSGATLTLNLNVFLFEFLFLFCGGFFINDGRDHPRDQGHGIMENRSRADGGFFCFGYFSLPLRYSVLI